MRKDWFPVVQVKVTLLSNACSHYRIYVEFDNNIDF